MVYEKKIEPIRSYELFFSGLSLQLWIIFFNILPWIAWSSNCQDILFGASVSSVSDMSETHQCIKEHRSGILAGCAFLLLGYPFAIAHIYYRHRMAVTLGAFLNLDHLRWLYNGSWIIICTIQCTIIPALGIFLSYYDWEFVSDYSYIGYSLQYQFFHFMLILYDSTIIGIGFTAAMPWFIQLMFIFGKYESFHYKLSIKNREEMMPNGCCCINCGGKWWIVILLGSVVCLCIFGSIGDVFDYEKDGFFSFKGESQYLVIICYISWQLQCLLDCCASRHLKARIQFLNENVQGMGKHLGVSNSNTAVASANGNNINSNNKNNNNNNNGGVELQAQVKQTQNGLQFETIDNYDNL